MTPLIIRPAYDALHLGESGLPVGDPADRGLSLDDSIPGTATYSKPEGDIREFDKADEGSIYRKDGPDDRAKKQDDPNGDQRNNEWLKPRNTAPGGRPDGDTTVTKWPYRDDHKTTHWASAQYVAETWKLRTAHELRLYKGYGLNLRLAVKMKDILDGLNPKVEERARSCTATLKRADTKNLRWIFSVDCGNGPKVVRIKAARKGRTTKFAKMDLAISCSCKAWSWLGSEHAAKQDGYLDGKPVGTASAPDIKDPQRKNRVCKHVASVLGMTRGWEIPPQDQDEDEE